MNALLGLPSTRVERVNPFSIFYLMHLMTALPRRVHRRGSPTAMLAKGVDGQAHPAIEAGPTAVRPTCSRSRPSYYRARSSAQRDRGPSSQARTVQPVKPTSSLIVYCGFVARRPRARPNADDGPPA